jgi:lysine biosynthesis protein LysW
MEKVRGKVIAFCLDCKQAITLGSDPRVGQKVVCSNCGAHLEIINLKPLELDWAYSEFEHNWEMDDENWD